ncbi:hypothetical protein LXL04_018155 [Taraxacum kok-saghyz]
MAKESKGPDSILCDLTPQKLEDIASTFGGLRSLDLALPDYDRSVLNPPAGRVAVYHHHLKGGLRLPLKSFIADVVQYFKVHVLQLAPNAMRKVVCFILISRILGVLPSLQVFCYFYIASPQGGWISISKRPFVNELCLGLSNSLKKWKPEFFFVKSEAYPFPMTISDLSSRKSDPIPELTANERVLVDRYSSYALWWTDPDEVILGLAGLSPYWDSLDPKPSLLVDGVEAGLAQRLTLGRDVIDVRPSSPLRPTPVDNVEPTSSLNSSTFTVAGDKPAVADDKHAVVGGRRSIRGKGVPSKPATRKRRYISSSNPEKTGIEEIPPATEEASASREGDSKQPRTSATPSTPDETTETAESIPASSRPEDLIECPVTDDLPLKDAVKLIPSSPSGVFVDENIPAGLRRTVDLPFPSSGEGNSDTSPRPLSPNAPVKPSLPYSTEPPVSTLAAAVPPVLPASTANIPSLDSAFHRSLFISGAGNFISSLPSDSKEMSPVLSTMAASPCIAPLTSSVATSAEAPGGGPLSPGIAAILQIGKAAPMPTIASLATSLPAFSPGYVPTGFPASPGSGKLSFEELMNLGRTHVLHGLHFFDQVNSLGCNQCAAFSAKRLELDRMSSLLEGERLNYQLLKAENDRLLQEVEAVNANNRLLSAHLEENKQQLQSLGLVNQDLEARALSASEKEKSATAEATSLSQQLEDFRALYTQKVADLDSLCSARQVTIMQQTKKIEAYESSIKDLSLQVARVTEESSKVRDKVYYYQHMADQRASDLLWLTQAGISACIRSVLQSDAFGESCASLQEASMKLGQANAYAILKDKYPSFFADKADLFPVSGVKELILERYELLVNQEYELLKFLSAKDMDVELLKKKLASLGVSFPA